MALSSLISTIFLYFYIFSQLLPTLLCYFPGLYPNSEWFTKYKEFGFDLHNMTPEQYVREIMDYRYNILLPITLWDPLPYNIHGRTFRETLGETSRFMKWASEKGFITEVSDAHVLPARLLGVEDYAAWGRWLKKAFFTFNIEEIREAVVAINSGKTFVDFLKCRFWVSQA